MTQSLNERGKIMSSARWAVYGDVLGFITELTDESGLQRRAGTKHIQLPVAWRRKIGGQFGVDAALPVGTYSDDTQLRLATSRAIRGDGTFDVEAFAKVELPVWASYALGAGRGSRAAAASLTKHVRTWSTNFFDDKYSRYIDGGGNGAAMRIQPHVWASKNRSDLRTYLPDVIRNGITTHGHPRGFLGAAFHAFVLAFAMDRAELPEPKWLQDNLGELRVVTSIVREDGSLQDFWLKKWELDSKRTLASAVDDTLREIQELLTVASAVEVSEPASMYSSICDVLDIRSDSRRGSGAHTAVAAYFLALLFQDDPRGAMEIAANELGTDTDSIATMAGAMLGATTDAQVPGALQDSAYIDEEARRLEAVSLSAEASTFSYPDLLHWHPPESQSDAVGLVDGKPVLSGLGYITTFGEVFTPKGKTPKSAWQWLTLDIGQSVLAKVREPMPKLPSSAIPARRDTVPKRTNVQQLPLTADPPAKNAAPSKSDASADANDKAAAALRGERFWDVRQERNRSTHSGNRDVERHSSQLSIPDVEGLAERIEELGFRHELIGRYISRFSEIEHGTELAAIFVSAVIRRLRKYQRDNPKA